MSSAVLLLLGAITAVLFVLVVTVEGARRPGYDPAYHTGSELALGDRGWVQRGNFFLIALGLAGFAVGIQQTLGTLLGGALLGVAAFGFLAAGLFVPDPVRGYPPGASTRGGRAESRHAKLHDLTGPVIFLALLAALATIAGRLDGLWLHYTWATVAVGGALVVATIAAYRADAAHTGRIQRVLILSCLLWVVVIGVALPAGVT